MSRLDELIAQFCPDGVEYKQLEEVLKIKNGSDYKHLAAGNIPVYGSGGIIAYVDTPVYNKPSILIPRKGSVDKLYFVETPFWNVDTIFYTEIITEIAIPKFVYYFLQREHLEKYNTAGGVPSLTQKVLNKITIPVPPLPVQQEIVRILDSFTQLTSSLQDKILLEKQIRTKQFRFYCNKILKTEKYVPISSLGEWQGGKTPSMAENNFWEDGSIPWISSKDMKSSLLSDTQDHITNTAVRLSSMNLVPAGSVAIVARSGILKHTLPVAYVPFETTVNQDIKILTVKDGVSARYVSFILQFLGEDILAFAKKQGGTVDSLDFQKFLAYSFPLPSLEIQLQMTDQFEKIENAFNSFSDNLSLETVSRQKQFEYYRDKLLSFNKA